MSVNPELLLDQTMEQGSVEDPRSFKRRIVMGMDGSSHAEDAFNCKCFVDLGSVQ